MMQYPGTRRTDVVEDHFGRTVADPYRWLEGDLRNDDEVAAWVAEQSEATRLYLADLPGRSILAERIRRLLDYERFTIPKRKAGRWFYFRQTGAQNQRVLEVRDGADGPPQILIDPNAWAEDGATAIAEWAPSDDGTRIAYTVQDGGSDWRTIRVLDVDTRETLKDELSWARFTSIEWITDGAGFFYTRFPEPSADARFQASIAGHSVYFHALGTPQAEDRLVHATPDEPNLVHSLGRTSDGRYLIILSTDGSAGAKLAIIDTQTADRTVRTIVGDMKDQWHVAGNQGSRFFLMTTRDAPRLKIVTVDVDAPEPVLVDLVGEQDVALSDGTLVGGRLLLSYLVDVKTEVRRFTLDGQSDGVVPLPGIGSAVGFEGGSEDREALFGFTSFDVPGTIFRYDVANNETVVWSDAAVSADLSAIAVEQLFYASKDGTRVPMFVIRRKDVTGPAPTMLYAYGGFGISDIPAFSPQRIAWIEQGGVYAVANVRGGYEYGRDWHEAGRRHNKQNVFDDFIAAAEYLKAEGIAAPDGLAIQGSSNGGLLIGAVVNQRPDLFAAALPDVGVMDMLRFDRFTGGKMWIDELGSPDRAADFETLIGYSPYHNIRAGEPYPAILATTADTDDRVVPAHSFKYVAALQAAEIGDRPHMIRIETRAGHGAGAPTDKIVEQAADAYAFAARWTGLEVRNP